MRKTIYFLIFAMFFSCNEKKIEHKKKPDNKEFNDQELQKIGHLYQPEIIKTRPIKLYTNSEKKNYEIDIFNSNTLKRDKENLKFHSDKIAFLLKKHLIKNEIDYNDIIVRIYQKKDGKKSFQYSKQDLTEIENNIHFNQSEKK